MNELTSFTNRDRLMESKLFATLMPYNGRHQYNHQLALNNQLNSSQLGLPRGNGSLSPSKIRANSFDLE